MLELVRLLIDTAGVLIPFRIVSTWQMGLYFWCGRYQWTTGPGIKLVFPYLCEVKTVSVVREVGTTPLQTITLRDGRQLTYSASIAYHVTDANLAHNTVGHWSETLLELSAGIISEVLADAESERFDPTYNKRKRLIEELREEINSNVKEFGLHVASVRLNNFALGVRTVRLLLDKAVLAEGNHFAV
jgi:regulator of protease activity HflC (stomatin/prohibitin superfamily)